MSAFANTDGGSLFYGVNDDGVIVGTVYLEVRESNAEAINLYKKYGFEQNGMRRNYYRHPVENAVLMMKKIDLAGD